MNSSSTYISYGIAIFLFSSVFSSTAVAVSAFQEQITYRLEKTESLGDSSTTRSASANFIHYRQLVNPFAGPVDEAAFLNHIGSIGVDFKYLRLKSILGGGVGTIEPSGIGYQFQYTHIVPNRPLTASLKVGKNTIEDEVAGGLLLEGTVKVTMISFGAYLSDSSHINLSSSSEKTSYFLTGSTIPENSTNILTLRYKKVLLNVGKKSFNFEVAYQKGDQSVNGANQSNDFNSVSVLSDVYFNSKTKVGFGFSSNTNKNTNSGDSRTFTLRGSFYFSRFSVAGFNYLNSNFDANIENQKSIAVFYKRLMM